MSDNQLPEVVFDYQFSPSFRVIAANGAHGGVTGRGDLRFDLFVESPSIPDEVIHSVTPDGLGPEIGRDPEGRRVTRELQVGVVMQLEQAKSFGRWLLERVSAAEQARNKQNRGTTDET